MTAPIQILRFWHDVELFNIPSPPNSRKQDRNTKVTCPKPGDRLPWAPGNSKFRGEGDTTWTHSVYVGVAPTLAFAEVVLDALQLEGGLTDDEREGRISGNGCLAGFVVNERGQPIKETYVRASFGLGVELLKQGKPLEGLSEKLYKAMEDFDMRRHSVDPPRRNDMMSGDATEEGVLGWAEIHEELVHAAAPFADVPNPLKFTFIIKSSRRNLPKRKDQELDITLDFMNSFYLNDLNILLEHSAAQQPFGRGLTTYLGQPRPLEERIDVLASAPAMSALLDPARIPLGRWPAESTRQLYLAQQAAVFSICHELEQRRGLISVNGPPGTGKTTLLSDVVTHVVVERARRIAQKNHPGDVFLPRTVVAGATFNPIDPAVAANSGIVVTSNNNSAVENISRQLPLAKEIAETEYPGAQYLRPIANKAFELAEIKSEAWGLAAAALGNMGNRKKFADALFSNYESFPEIVEDDYKIPDACTMKLILETAIRSNEDWHAQWQDVRKRFVGNIQKLEQHKKWLAGLNKALADHPKALKALEQADLAIREHATVSEQEKARWAEQQALAELLAQEARDEKAAAERQITGARREVPIAVERMKDAEQTNRPSALERILRSLFGYETTRYRAWEEAKAAARKDHIAALDTVKWAEEALQEAEDKCAACDRALAACKAGAERAAAARQEQLVELQTKRDKAQQKVSQNTSKLTDAEANGIRLPSPAFWGKPQDERHLATVWTSPALDQLRSQCFLDALQLHELTLKACATKVISNLRAVCDMLRAVPTEPYVNDDMAQLWDMLFFVVPVVSTTLASFGTLFNGIGQEKIGWVLVDEAGQATPQSTVGALWRASRAVIIGDPLQIPPVMTVPSVLIARLRRKYDVDLIWSPSTMSAQVLADRTMPTGAWVGPPDMPSSTWTGLPLRAHRRCTDPMFQVANEIAYQNQMVQANTKPKKLPCVLGPSQWFDVKGQSANAQVVDEELAELRQLLGRMRDDWPLDDKGELATAYIISPFKKVANACEQIVSTLDLDKRHDVECGTVHAFQGKQADIVFIVLGSAPGKKGYGSRDWASATPNLLNVALTRAKSLVYLVGNKTDWRSHKFFDLLTRRIDAHTKRELALLTTSDQSGRARR